MADPQKSTIEAEHKELADLMLSRALTLMTSKGIPAATVMDRLATFAAGAHVQLVGEQLAARCFRVYANRIEGGLFTVPETDKGRQH